MPHIFISYSRVDRPFVEQFAKRLNRMFRDYTVWYDDELLGGDFWWEEILNQVAKCDIFIYLLSNESVNSEYCKAEFTEACRLQKRILTVQVRDRTKISADLSDIQYVDMSKGINDADAQALLVASIRRQTELIPKRPPKPVRKKPTSRPGISDAETPSPSEPIDTPTLRLVHPVELSESRAIVRAAWITGIMAVVAAGTAALISLTGSNPSIPVLITPTTVIPVTETAVVQNSTETPMLFMTATSSPTEGATITATATDLPTNVPVIADEPSLTPTYRIVTACLDLPTPRLIPGRNGYVTPGIPNVVRSAPGIENLRIGAIPVGGEFAVLEGPVCEDGFAWWHVNYEELDGWTAEGNERGYWLAPLE